MNIPLPGELVGIQGFDTRRDVRVIASMYYIDDPDRPQEFILVILNDKPPYYSVVEVQVEGEGMPEVTLREITSWEFMNIIPAARFYDETFDPWGGD